MNMPMPLFWGNFNQAYSAVTRAQSIHVFRQCLSTLYMVKENHPQAAAYATQQVLPQWVEAFNQLLSASSLGDAWGEMYIRNAIFQVSRDCWRRQSPRVPWPLR